MFHCFGCLFSNGLAVSQIEEINIKLNRNVNSQSPATTYGAKGAWTNLHVAVLAYDSAKTTIPISNEAMEVETTENLCMGIPAAQRAQVSTESISLVGCECTLYFKEA